MNLYFFAFLHFTILLFPFSNFEKKNAFVHMLPPVVVQDNNIKTYKTTNQYLTSFQLQQYKNKPRIGILNSGGYYIPGKRENMDYQSENNSKQQMALLGEGIKDLSFLLQLQFLTGEYTFLDQENVTDDSRKFYASRKEQTDYWKSYRVQDHLLLLAKELLTQDAMYKFICSKDRYDHCNNWGGIEGSQNEFIKKKSYNNFISEVYPDLIQWASSMETNLYLVTKANLGTYDFEKESFPIGLTPFTYEAGHFIYEPQEEFESYFSSSNSSLPIDMKMSPEQGEQLKTRMNKLKQSYVFVLWEIKVDGIKKDKYFDARNNMKNLRLSYHLSSPNILVFEDEELTKKMYDYTLH